VVHKCRLNTEHAFARRLQRELGARPEDTIRTFDALHRAALDLESTASRPGLPAAMVQVLVATSAASEALFAAGRRVYVAQMRLGRGDAALAAALLKASQAELAKAEDMARGLEWAWRANGPQRRLLQVLWTDAASWQVVAAVEACKLNGPSEPALALGLQVGA
jgi:hypothetical protein